MGGPPAETGGIPIPPGLPAMQGSISRTWRVGSTELLGGVHGVSDSSEGRGFPERVGAAMA